MIPMRVCEDQTKIEHFLSSARIGFLGLTDGNSPYVVPLNYLWWNGSIYFHGSDHGKKVDLMNGNPTCCFTVSQEYGTIAHPVPAHTDTAYMSVILYGTAELVTDLDEATEALDLMLSKYVPEYYASPLSKEHVAKYRSSRGYGVALYRIQAESMTAKENPVKTDEMFYPGRTQKMDVGKKAVSEV